MEGVAAGDGAGGGHGGGAKRGVPASSPESSGERRQQGGAQEEALTSKRGDERKRPDAFRRGRGEQGGAGAGAADRRAAKSGDLNDGLLPMPEGTAGVASGGGGRGRGGGMGKGRDKRGGNGEQAAVREGKAEGQGEGGAAAAAAAARPQARGRGRGRDGGGGGGGRDSQGEGGGAGEAGGGAEGAGGGRPGKQRHQQDPKPPRAAAAVPPPPANDTPLPTHIAHSRVAIIGLVGAWGASPPGLLTGCTPIPLPEEGPLPALPAGCAWPGDDWEGGEGVTAWFEPEGGFVYLYVRSPPALSPPAGAARAGGYYYAELRRHNLYARRLLFTVLHSTCVVFGARGRTSSLPHWLPRDLAALSQARQGAPPDPLLTALFGNVLAQAIPLLLFALSQAYELVCRVAVLQWFLIPPPVLRLFALPPGFPLPPPCSPPRIPPLIPYDDTLLVPYTPYAPSLLPP